MTLEPLQKLFDSIRSEFSSEAVAFVHDNQIELLFKLAQFRVIQKHELSVRHETHVAKSEVLSVHLNLRGGSRHCLDYLDCRVSDYL